MLPRWMLRSAEDSLGHSRAHWFLWSEARKLLLIRRCRYFNRWEKVGLLLATAGLDKLPKRPTRSWLPPRWRLWRNFWFSPRSAMSILSRWLKQSRAARHNVGHLTPNRRDWRRATVHQASKPTCS